MPVWARASAMIERVVPALDDELWRIPFAYARQSIASWFGLAKHALAFRLSRGLFLERDVRNIGKRLLVKVRCAA